MKTLELNLKKDVLIVDENDFDYYEIFKEGVYFKLENGDREYLEGEFEFFCKGSELTEEIASNLCHNIGNCLTIEGNAYLDDEHNEDYFEFAKDSIISAIESKNYHWLENPIKVHTWASENADEYYKQWQESEEKTFKNPLIFVKK